MEVKECIKIWRRLRDRFVRDKKATKGRSGDAGGKKVWALYHRMLWLDVHVKHRETTSNFDNKVNISRFLNSLFVLVLEV